jgi:hypothetical protein
MSTYLWFIGYAVLGVSFIRSEHAPVRLPKSEIKILAPVTKGAQRDVPAPKDYQILKSLDIPAMPGQRIRIQKTAEYMDPPRIYPLIGPAQLCHARYDCTVESRTCTKRAIVFQNHLHMLGE